MKERVKEKLSGRPAKLNEKKGDRQKTKETFFVGRTTRKFCSGEEEMRNPRGHQCKLKMSGSKKKKRTRTLTTFPPIHKTCY